MTAPVNLASPLLPLLGLIAVAIVLAWGCRRVFETRNRFPGRRGELADGRNLARVQLRLHRLEDDLETPLRQQMQSLDRLIRLGDDEIVRLREKLALDARSAASVALIRRQPDLILAIEPDRPQPAEAPGEARWKKAA